MKKLSKKKTRTRLPENLQKGYNAYRFLQNERILGTSKEKVFYAIQTISLIEFRWRKKPLAKRKY